MKALFKKSWFIGTLIVGLSTLVFFLDLSILSIKLKRPINDNFWVLAGEVGNGDGINVFALIITILFYLSILPILYSGFSLYRKNNKGHLPVIIYLFSFEVIFVVFQAIFKYMSAFAIVLNVFNIIFTVSAFVFYILAEKMFGKNIAVEKKENEIEITNPRFPLYVLIVDIVAVVILLITFFIPVYRVDIPGNSYSSILIGVLFSSDTYVYTVVHYLVNFGLTLLILLYFANSITHYFYDKPGFIKKSKNLINYIFIITIIFFAVGLTMYIYHTFQKNEVRTASYVPMILMSAIIFAFSILIGKFNAYTRIESKVVKSRYSSIEPLIYIILMTFTTVSMLFFRIIKIQVSSGSYSNTINMTGINILSDYADLNNGYRMVAFILAVMLMSIGLGLVIAISSYFSKYSKFNSIVKTVAGVNVFFTFVISISGYYFQIGQQINMAVIQEIFAYYNITIPSNLSNYQYNISTDAIYSFIASALILVLMFIRKSFDREEKVLVDAEALNLDKKESSESETQTTKAATEVDDETHYNFDPCPAFTELDLQMDAFNQELTRRKELKTIKISLPDLIYFVVEYARNSRLHLSYTEEDIATFVAGLGASKLSILQGMSGTGKTSLPKIFSEAIYGNCEIVEVESSWKDKNELLGYYNEFSMKYTPKKFTLALYKAALNKEVVTFILLDEMNLSRIEYYFSDFLSLMEHEEHKREIKLININLNRVVEGESIDYLALDRGHTLKVAPNIWFIGTANRDESTFVISDKVYDRAQTMNFMKRAPKVRNYANPLSQQFYDYDTINMLLNDAKALGNFDAENNEIIKGVEALLAPYNISFGNRILKQIEDFVNIYKACFANENVEKEAIEKILLSKVVAKLEVKAIDDKEKLMMEFEKLNLKQCVEFIKRLDND